MNIFVAKLDHSTTKESLERAFSQYGEVTSAKVIMDRETGRSKCYGFVEMDAEAGNAAIAGLNESELDGRQILVKESAPQPQRKPRRSFNNDRNNNRY